MSNHAVVFGASGLLGWSVLSELIASSEFSKVTAVLNRPATAEQLCLSSDKLDIVSGINLIEGTGETLAKALTEAAPAVRGVTHAFYFVFYSQSECFEEECKINCSMMQRVAVALNTIAPSLKTFVYSGGTRGYGIYVPNGTFTPPLREELADQLPPDYAKTVAYPWFRQILTEESRNRSWTWTEICPDAVIGFSPIGSGFSLALHWGQYLSLYRLVEGEDAEVPFPGCAEAAKSKFSPVSGPILGRASIYAALHPDECAGKVINVADNALPSTYEELWPRIAAWFKLRGAGPGDIKPSEYIANHKHLFEQKAPKALTCGVGAGAKQLDAVGWWLTFDRQLSVDRLRGVGFGEERDPAEGWIEAFERLRAAKIIL